jgi:hypothetical protein
VLDEDIEASPGVAAFLPAAGRIAAAHEETMAIDGKTPIANADPMPSGVY